MYSLTKSLSNLQDVHADSIFFNPLSTDEERESFCEGLVETFNKLVILTKDTDMVGILNAVLVMPYLVLSKALEEAMKHAGYVVTICKVRR